MPGNIDSATAGVDKGTSREFGGLREVVLVCLPPTCRELLPGVRESGGASLRGVHPVRIVVYWTG
jgi:hypothetical protein